jgi:LmbE family N-acetylglucosaminyl deacetylase
VIHIVYAPHEDDETLGLGGQIAQWKRDGERVVLVLLTESEPSTRIKRIFRGELLCPVHQQFHTDEVDLTAARAAEFHAAAQELGIDQVDTFHLPETMVTEDRQRFVAEVKATLSAYERSCPGAVHHLVSGDRDVALPTLPATHPTHRACWEAGEAMAVGGLTVLFHRIYGYRFPLEQRTADRIVTLSAEAMAVKRAALAEYQRWEPPTRIGFSWHSVPDLLSAAEADAREFVDLPATGAGRASPDGPRA